MRDNTPQAAASESYARGTVGFPREWLIAIALVFVAAHAALAALDYNRPAVFLRADRAEVRSLQIQGLLATHTWQDARDYLGSHGIVGDYAAHALLYALGGRPMIILFQIMLLLASGVGIVGLARLLGLPPLAQAAAVALYFVLPHSLVFPHQLATEALQVPLLVISTWLLCIAVRDQKLWLLLCSALLLGLATLIRPITLLWPAAPFLICAFLGRKRFGAIFVMVAYAPVLLWMAFVWETTGTFGLGESSHSLARNLYMRVAEVAAGMPPVQAQKLTAEHLAQSGYGRMGVGEYLEVALQYPGPFAAAAARDAAVFWGKSGIERLTVDYLGSEAQFAALTDRDIGWRKRLDTESLRKTLQYVWRYTGPVLLISLSGSLLLITMVGFALYGAVAWIRRPAHSATSDASNLAASLLIVLPIYVFMFSLVVMSARSGHRAPAEFALVLLSVYGFYSWRQLRFQGFAQHPAARTAFENQEASNRPV